MWYAEKIIDGVMHYKNLPNGKWHKMTDVRLTAYIVKLQKDLQRL